MKKGIIILFVFAISGVILHSCKSEPQFKVGMDVAAKWADNNYYLATISGIDGEKYAIDYADGTKGEAIKADMKAFTEKDDLKTGDKVLAVWAGAKLYSGIVKEMKETSAMVAWDDGSAPSEIAYGKILKIEK